MNDSKPSPQVQILVDNPTSWIAEPSSIFCDRLVKKGFAARFLQSHSEITAGDVLVLLGCEQMLKADKRTLNRHNLVVHESALPHGKGMSPLTWQILEGRNTIPVTLFEAVDELDAGPIYLQCEMEFEGHELIEELREAQAKASFGLIEQFLSLYPNVQGVEQSGEETVYPRRTPEASELHANKSFAEQFNLLRVVDNERYPAFFRLHGKRYKISIEKVDEEGIAIVKKSETQR